MSETVFHGQMQCLGGFSTKDVFDKRFTLQLEQLPPSLALRIFRSGVKPVWEDPANCGQGAGKWIIQGENEEVVTAAFDAVLEKLSAQSDDIEGINGCIFVCKRGQHVLMLWTRAHPPGTHRSEEDPYHVQQLVTEISQQIGFPLSASFKQHGKKGRKGTRSVPSSPMLHGKRQFSPQLCPSAPHSPIKSPSRQDSDYSFSPSPKMSPMLLASDPIQEHPEELVV